MPFSESAARAAVNFFELGLKHSADEWYGKPFLLCPWQELALCRIFGDLDDEGNRLIELVYLEVPKKAGKTEFVAGILLFVLVTAKQPGFQVYGAASATRQALNVYRAACKMVEQSPLLRSRLRILRSTHRILRKDDPDSFYAAVAADGDFSDGVNPGFTVADEVHRWKTRKQLENWDVLSKGGITRRQTLTIAITTAGVQNESPLAWRLHEKTKRIEEGIVSDGRFYGRIYAADPEDDSGDPKTWIKANPSLKQNGGFLELDKIRKEYETAVSEGDLTAFRRYFLNLWDQKEERVIPMAQWDTALGEWTARGLGKKAPEDEVRPLHRDVLAHFIDRRCWIGVDLSMTTDMTSVVCVFDGEDDTFEWLPFFWCPRARLKDLERKLGMPLQQWERDGFLEVTEGGSVDYREVRARIEWATRMFRVEEICWDPWNSRQLTSSMTDDGFTCVEIRQGFGTLSEPSKKVLSLVANGKLHHGGHPILRWNASCAGAVRDRKDNVMFAKPDREKSTARIDGLAAGVNAMARALVVTEGAISFSGLRTVG